MPDIQAREYLALQIGVDPGKPNPASDTIQLINAAKKLQNALSCVLYDAVVKLSGKTAMTGPAITPQQLNLLGSLAASAKSQRQCSPTIRDNLEDFAAAAKRYAEFLVKCDNREMYATSVLKKKLGNANNCKTQAKPRHTLIKNGTKIYEVLTWMTGDEIARIKRCFPQTEGLFSIRTERSRTKDWGNQKITEDKITLGSGGFGSARIVREVDSDQYMVLKKSHPKLLGPKPTPAPIVARVNDGRLSGVSRVYDGFLANSTRGGGIERKEPSAYTLSELGITDVYKFNNAFLLMAYSMNQKNNSEPLALLIRESMVSGTTPQEKANHIERLSSSPCSNPETVRKFRNTLAKQMLESVQQMHSRDRAHNDLKPDNFILAYDEKKQLRVKLIDFDLNDSVKASVGKARDIYAQAFSAPQVSSTEVNNQADRNDAYSMGCTFRVLNGEPVKNLIVQRMAARGEIKDDKNKALKPVEDRRAIEARFACIPELTTLADLANLLCHPHSGKRYTISEALNSPLFTQPGNVLDDARFSAVAERIIRHGRLVPRGMIDRFDLLQQIEHAAVEQSGEPSKNPLDQIESGLQQDDRRLLLDRYKETHGEAKLKIQMEKVNKHIAAENGFALLRRGFRQLNIGYQFQSPAEREAGYVYKTPKK